MGYTFDGPNKLIILTSGTTAVSVRDMWSRWVDWFCTGDNSKYLPAMYNIGGDDLGGGRYLGISYFLENGWKIRPQEANHTLALTGNLYSRDGGSPFVSTLGAFNVSIQMSVSNLVDQVATGGGSSLTAAQVRVEMDSNSLMSQMIAVVEKVLRNKTITDPETGLMTVYDNDGVTPLLQGNLFEDAAGTQPYRGQGAERRDRMA